MKDDIDFLEKREKTSSLTKVFLGSVPLQVWKQVKITLVVVFPKILKLGAPPEDVVKILNSDMRTS